MIEVRQARIEEHLELRALRLRALADAPYAFSTLLAEAESLPEEWWRARVRAWAEGTREVMFVAVDADAVGSWCGMARGVLSQDESGSAEVASLWVEPARRNRGVGRALIESVRRWSVSRGVSRLRLWVTESNSEARTFYHRVGFRETEQRQPARPDEEAMEVLLVLELGT